MNQKMSKLYIIPLILLLLTACGPEETLTPHISDAVENTPTIVPATNTPEHTKTEELPPPAPVSEELPQLPLVDDFEMGELLSGQDANASIGFITWSDGSAVSVQKVTVAEGDDLALPDQTTANTILQLNTEVASGGWSGFSHAFANAALDTWTPQDWSPYEGISMWLYGNATGGTLFIDILDNRNANSTGDDAERWTAEISDDFEGWQFIEIPFTEFSRKDIGNSAPNDGFTLTEIHGYALGAFGSANMGAQANYLDQVMLFGEAGERPVEISLAETSFRAKEGGAATIKLKLNKPADDTVSVQYMVMEGNASPEDDFSLPGDTVVFNPGEMTQSVKIEAVVDSLAEGNEQTLIVLYNPTGAILNPQSRAILTIRDSETIDPELVFDFNQPPPFLTTEGVTLTILSIEPDDAIMKFSDQVDKENILKVSYSAEQSPASFGPIFPAGQDWSNKTGMSFWYYGNNSGESVTLELLNNPANTTADISPEEWTLVWSDEFDDPPGTSPNPGIWQPEIGDGMLNGIPGWGNGEFEYYTNQPDNASTDGAGNLVITALQLEPESSNLMCWYGPCEFTSARLITWGRVEFEFGRVEARLKLPFGQGIWPAFWMLGTNLDEVGWPQSGEIDIMENIGREPATVHGTIHGPGYSGGQGIGAGYDLAEGNFSDDFHIFAIEWTPDQIEWLVDDQVYAKISAEDIPAGTEWVYNQPFFIILNLAVGGNWPGSPDETSTFPQTLMVDYVRVFGAPNTSERFTYSFVDDFDGWQQVVIPFEAFERSAEQPQDAPDDGLDLTEIWGYNFVLSPNTDSVLYLDKFRLETELP